MSNVFAVDMAATATFISKGLHFTDMVDNSNGNGSKYLSILFQYKIMLKKLSHGRHTESSNNKESRSNCPDFANFNHYDKSFAMVLTSVYILSELAE